MSTSLFPGKGRPLNDGTSTGKTNFPETPVIQAAGYSEKFTIGDGHKDFSVVVEVQGGAAAAGDVLIELGDDTFSNPVTFQTLATNTKFIASFTNGKPALGNFRLKNNTTKTIKAWLQINII